jgi:hypothetical protein
MGEPLFGPQKLWIPPLFSINRGDPITKLAEHEVDLVQERLDLTGLGGSL